VERSADDTRVDPEGVAMGHATNYESTGTPVQDRQAARRLADRRLRITARFVAGAFGVATVTTGIVCTGAYCLTVDGGDFRRLRSSEDTGMSPSMVTALDISGPSCAAAPAALRSVDTPEAASAAGQSAARAKGLKFPIDRVAQSELRTATFALG
jgi:hypothetical protein